MKEINFQSIRNWCNRACSFLFAKKVLKIRYFYYFSAKFEPSSIFHNFQTNTKSNTLSKSDLVCHKINKEVEEKKINEI